GDQEFLAPLAADKKIPLAQRLADARRIFFSGNKIYIADENNNFFSYDEENGMFKYPPVYGLVNDAKNWYFVAEQNMWSLAF
ncbi:MAG: hypothetical protein RRY34_09385, partial [Victivallaceae bacterium]